jgi:pseudouridine synthase
MRINRFLSHAGIGSRRKVEEFVRSGLVRVNGKVVRDLSTTINPDADVVEFRNRRVIIKKYYYLLLNKPRGYITTVSDERGRKQVMELVPERYRIAGVVPVGRLDKDTEGLLLLTNDGDVAYVLTHPKFQIVKEYLVEIDRALDEAVKLKIENGVFIAGEKTAPAEINRMNEAGTLLNLKIREGKKRQIRISFNVFSYRVKKLKRISFGPLKLRSLPSGSYRELKEGEIRSVRKLAEELLQGIKKK